MRAKRHGSVLAGDAVDQAPKRLFLTALRLQPDRGHG
jgi:hypothetical protein